MKADWRPYTEWEDYQAGMYRDATATERAVMATNAAGLLADTLRLTAAMRAVATEWRFAAEANLHEPPNNRAWLGQAACCYAAGSTEDATRQAWGMLTDGQRAAANAVADRVISEWKYRTKRNPQMEFCFDA
jgi:hypothetical protein